MLQSTNLHTRRADYDRSLLTNLVTADPTRHRRCVQTIAKALQKDLCTPDESTNRRFSSTEGQ
jgi:hypothetical protein